MKKYIAAVLIVMFLAAFSWAQGTRELFDVKKSQEELEIMKGILSTTLSFVSQNARRTAGSATANTTTLRVRSDFGGNWRFSSISAYYLVGQGAVFSIPGSGFGTAFFNEGDLEAITKDAIAMSDRAVALAAQSPKVPPAASAQPTPPAAGQNQSQEEMRKKLAEQLEKAKKSREDLTANREKAFKALSETKVYLIEAIANYGDSLTTVKPNEYINVVFSTDGDLYGPGSHRDIISVQKSAITDYKAGRLTLDAFKQKVLQYQQ